MMLAEFDNGDFAGLRCPKCQSSDIDIYGFDEENSASELVYFVGATCSKCGHSLAQEEIYS